MKGKMVKLTGPALSLDASKSLGKLMTFQKRPSGHAVYFKSRPGDISPLFPTAPQVVQRALIAEAVAAWKALSAAEKASWEVSAKAASYQGTGYHYYIHCYQGAAPAPPPPPTPEAKYCLDIVTSDASARIPASDSLTNGFTQLCIECFVNLDNYPAEYAGMVSGWGTMPVAFWYLLIWASGIYRFAVNSNGAVQKSVDSAIVIPKDGNFHHIAATFDGDVMRLFMDGVQDANTRVETFTPMNAVGLLKGFAIGSLWYDLEDYGRAIDGRIDEVRVSKVPRYTAGFTVPTARFVNDADTLGLWHLDEGVGTTSADASSNGNNITGFRATINWVAGHPQTG